MTTQIRKISALSAIALLTSLIGMPTLADDTELLLVNPNPNSLPKPNVMFILDTSGSMQSEEETNAPYDPTEDYKGECDENMLYWTDVNAEPDCSDDDNKQFIEKDEFYCDDAAAQLAGVGTYTGVLVQYREDDTGLENWQDIEVDNDRDPVECQADSGLHGDGTAGMVFATALGNQKNPWTNSKALEISWGSAPRNVTYTVYDGNYLNWKSSPSKVRLSRNKIMRSVVTSILGSVENMNVGLMRFNWDDGGVVIQDIADLSSNRAKIVNAVNNLNANGYTPLAETMYEAALFWHGLGGYYAENVAEFATDPNALFSTGPAMYDSPQADSCAKNYNVLLTDGQPVRDTEAQSLAPKLPDFAKLLKRTACTGTDQGDCLDDISEYLSLKDIDPNVSGTQNVTTHTIGFAIDLPLLKETAEVSGGQYFLADDVESLTKALLEIIADINQRSLSFTAPAVSVNTFNRTQNINSLYLTMFGAKPNVHWPGNLKRYGISKGQIIDSTGAPAVDPSTGYFYDSSVSFWTSGGADGNDVTLSGAANQLPNPAQRNLYTYNGDKDLTAFNNQVSTANIAAFSDADFGLSGGAGEPTRDEIIRWARGEDIRDEDDDPSTTVRKAMGDPLHSQPAAVVYGGTPQNPDIVVFMGTNDGYLHAIDGATGAELWSFVPFELLKNFSRLYFDPRSKFKNYGIDGDIVPVVRDQNKNGIIDGTDYVHIIFGMRRGGSSYFALDVTNKNKPELLWKNSYKNAGQSWSPPVVARVDVSGGGLNNDKAVIIIGDGYDTVHDSATQASTPDAAGTGIRMLDLKSGKELWWASRTEGDLKLPGMTRSIATRIRVLDISGDGLADRMYASDMGGQIWRFDIYNGNGSGNLVTGGVIAQLGAEGTNNASPADTRRFYNTPDVSIFTDPLQKRRYLAVSIGSGYRAHPFDLSAKDRFFSLRDPDPFRQLNQNEYDNYSVIGDGDLVNVTGQKKVILNPTARGWSYTLPDNQKVLADSVTFNDTVYFVAFSPQSDGASACGTGQGTNYLYQVSIVNGDPIVNNLDALSDDDAEAARQDKLAQGGIAPSPTILFPSPEGSDCKGADCSPPPIGCVGVECFDPGFVNNPVRTLWTQDGIQ